MANLRYQWPNRLRAEGITPLQVVFQLLVVTIGVYIAVLAQDKAQLQDRRSAASDLIAAIDEELEEDEDNMREVIASQQNLRTMMEAIAGDARDSNPDTTISRILEERLIGNRTFFPRRAAYAALLGSGQLQYIEDRELRLMLANVYEQDYSRLAINSDISDQIYQGIFRAALLGYWDYVEDEPIGRDDEARVRLSNAAYRVREFSVSYEALIKRQAETVAALRKRTGRYAKGS